jgi:hypothetical protein
MKTVTLRNVENNCQRCQLRCRGDVYILGKGFAFPLIICKKCARKIRNGLNKAFPAKKQEDK